jgi:signal transduction histidine kinase/CheY-like chemotaxis protein/ligand-binding sensor domain-containing protein/AraC-like DNA-binding protein
LYCLLVVVSLKTENKILMKRGLLFLWLLVVSAIVGNVHAEVSDMIVSHYTVEQGLTNNIVNSALKSRDGFLWFGTWYGLCRFDGSKFMAYNKFIQNGSNQAPRKIECMREDTCGNLWLKTKDWKISVFFKKHNRFQSVYEEIKRYSRNIQIIKMQNSADGGILLLTKDKNLLLANTDNDGRIAMQQLVASRRYVNPVNLVLTQNILSETANHISWVGKDFNIMTVKKLKNTTITRNIFNKSTLTCAYQRNIYDMLVGSADGTVYEINAKNGFCRSIYIKGVRGSVTNILVGKGNKAYISIAGAGLYEYSLTTGAARKIAISIDCSSVSGGYVDKMGIIWLTESDRAIVCFNPADGFSKRFPLTLSGHICEPEFCDAGQHGLFYLSASGEAMRFDRANHTVEWLSQLPQIMKDEPRQSFLGMYLDSDGQLWLTSSNCGVYLFNFPPKQFRIISLPEDENGGNNSGVRSMYQMKNGDVLVGTRSRDLYILDKSGKLKQTFSYDSYKIGSVYYIMPDRSGNLWLSTKGDGLVMMTPDKNVPSGYRFQHFKHDASDVKSISGNNVYVTFLDSHNHIWVGTLDGGLNLIVQTPHGIEFKNRLNGFIHYPAFGLYLEVRNMTEDRSGRIWVGTIDGLMSFSSGFRDVRNINFEIYRRPNLTTYANSDVYSLYRDSERNIWLCAFGGGLVRLSGYDAENHVPLFTTLGKREGLLSDVVVSMVEDGKSRLWMATSQGLSCLNKTTERIINFDEYDGFPDVTMEETASLCNSNGEIWMGTKKGILVFRPDILKSAYSQYPTYIVGCEVNNEDIYAIDGNPLKNQSITYAGKIVLKHNQSMFTIEFATLKYGSQDRVNYRYILKGYESEWHYNGKNRIASYTNVPPGNYTFRVETMDGTNSNVHSGRNLQITILPPWWRTWWADTIYFLLAMLIVYAAFRITVYMMRIREDIYINNRLAELKIKFFTNISHELRTPLTLIQGSLSELKSNETLSEKGTRYLRLIDKNSRQMIQLVNQILDFRRIQNGKMRLHVSLVCLNAMLDAFMDEFRVLAEERSLKYEITLPDYEVKAWIDEQRMAVVVRNVLSNAFKFTPHGGTINVLLKDCDEDNCQIEITNSGSSIPEDKLSAIFERFSQADTGTNEKYYGTGIGLAVSKEIMNLHHGRLYAENKEGEGVAFFMDIQKGKEHFGEDEVDFYMSGNESVDAEMKDEAPAEETATDDKDKPVVLVVDDNRDLCMMISMQLETQYKVLVAYDGEEALTKIKDNHPDLVVTDQMMPKMDGMELLRRVRADFDISHIPVIILTAKGDDESKTRAISMGANAFITKPFSKDYLMASIGQLLSQRTIFRQQILEETQPKSDYGQYLKDADVKFLDSIHRVIEENLCNSDFNIDAIATEMGISRSSFFKKVKSLTGFSPVDFIKEYRLNKAVELLTSSDLSVKEVAYQSGFSDVGYFGKCFRKKFGKSPREYLNAMNK